MSRHITGTVNFSVRPSPEELADCFWVMGAEEQARFFSRLGESAREMLVFQLQAVTDAGGLSADGRWAMKMIGDYSEQNP